MDLQDYLTLPSSFVRKDRIVVHKKVREIVSYNGSGGLLLREKHEAMLESFDVLPTSPLSYAYKKGVKLLDAVKPHLGHVAFLKLDIKGFFEHIDFDVLSEKLKAYGLESELAYCFHENHLPIGLVTSPKLSDFYFFGLDTACEKYVREHPSLTYSRYADDFLLSSANEDFAELDAFASFIGTELAEVKLFFNEEKRKKFLLGKQTSVRFLGLNIGKDKITVSKWYVLKTLNAFRKYRIARYNRSPEVGHYKGIAYGLYAFIRDNSPSSLERFQKKYANLFGEPFPALLPKKEHTEFITYELCKGGETYRAVLTTIKEEPIPHPEPETTNADPADFFSFIDDDVERPGEEEEIQGPESIYVPNTFHGAKVVSVSAAYYDNRFEKLQRLRLPKGLRCIDLRGRLPLITEPLLGEVVDLSHLRAKNKVPADCLEVGILAPHFDRWDYDETVFSIKKVYGGYKASECHNGSWAVTGMEFYEKEESVTVDGNEELDRLFRYLVEKVLKNRVKYSFGRLLFIRIGDKEIRCPRVDIETIAVFERFFGRRIDFDTKPFYGRDAQPVESVEQNTHPVDKPRVGNPMEFSFVLGEGKRIAVSVDFTMTDYGYPIHFEDVERKSRSLKRETSCFHMFTEPRALELLQEGMKDCNEKIGPIKVTFQEKAYYAKDISSRLFHLLQFLSPIPFDLPEGFVRDEGYGEYYFVLPETEAIPDGAYQNLEGVKAIRICDKVPSIGKDAFRGNRDLERVYLSTRYYAYRNLHLDIGEGAFMDCPNFEGYVRSLLGKEEQRFNFEKHKLDGLPSVEIEIRNEDDLKKLDELPKHALIHVIADKPYYGMAREKLDAAKGSIVTYELRMGKMKPDPEADPSDDDDDLPF